MATTTSKDEWGNPINLPDVPSPQMATPTPINFPNWSGYLGGGNTGGAPDPYDAWRMQNIAFKQMQGLYPTAVNMELGQMPAITSAMMAASGQAFPMQLQQQQLASQRAFEEQMRQYGIAGPQIAQQNAMLMGQYAPQYGDILRQQGIATANQLQGQVQQYDPEFMSTYSALGGRIGEGLAAGYELGPDLQREIEQSIRSGQSARGNYIGPAATAQEAFGTGSAAINLYNQRIGAAQNFLAGPQPTSLWAGMQTQFAPGAQAMGSIGQTAMPGLGYSAQAAQGTAGNAALGAMGAFQNPSIDYSGQGAQAYSTWMGGLGQYSGQNIAGQTDFNTAMNNAADINNTGMFNAYDKSFDQFLYKESVAHGLYNTPAAPNTSGAQTGAIIQGVGSAVGAVGSAAAASAAAAAFCWLARRVLPDRWLEWREFLFTKAPAWFRSKYIYGAKLFSDSISIQDEPEIAFLMIQCLQKR